MPDLDDFDLDAAFTSLQRDIASTSRPRGAGLAVATARRRRRRRTTGAVAAAIVTVAALTGGGLLVTRHSTVPAADQPPGPAELTPAALSAATAGWVDGWTTPTATSAIDDNQLNTVSCLTTAAGSNVLDSPARRGTSAYVTGRGQLSYLIGLDFTGAKVSADEAANALDSAVAACTPTATQHTTYTDGSSATFYEVPSAKSQPDVQLWTARVGDRLALLAIGADGSAPPTDTVARVDDALVAAIQSDATFNGDQLGGPSTSSSSSSAGPAMNFDTISDDDLAGAMGAWPSGWSRTTKATNDIGQLPCNVQAFGTGSSYGQGSSLGGNGSQEVSTFGTDADATAGLASLSRQLAACTSAAYEVTTVSTPDGPVTVVSGAGQGVEAVWIVQRGRYFGVVSVPGGGVPPPEAVSRAIGALIYGVLAHPKLQVADSTAPTPQESPGGVVASASAQSAPKG